MLLYIKLNLFLFSSFPWILFRIYEVFVITLFPRDPKRVIALPNPSRLIETSGNCRGLPETAGNCRKLPKLCDNYM